MMKLKVECYSGYKANERPVSFSTDHRNYIVIELIDKWYGPDYTYFRVKADDNNIYILKYDEKMDEWSLSSYRQEKERL